MEPADVIPPPAYEKVIKTHDPEKRPDSRAADPEASHAEAKSPAGNPSLSPSLLRDYQFWNVLGVSLAFMVLFSAFHTSGVLSASVLADTHDEHFNGTGREGYYSAATIYTVMAISNWIAPPVITYTGPKYGMLIGGIPYCLYMAVFLRPLLGTLYASSVLLGIGAAIIWTAQGVFLTMNSTDATMSRNAGMFWAILQFSNLWGFIFATVKLSEENQVSASTRFTLFAVLLVVAIVGVIGFVILKYPGTRDRGRAAVGITLKKESLSLRQWRQWAWIQEIVASAKLQITRNMLLLSVTFAYTGFMLTFYSGVYGTAIHFTGYFGKDRNYLLGLNGILIGIGEIIAGIAFGLTGSYLHRLGRSVITVSAVVIQLIAYLLVFLYFPYDSPAHLSTEETYVTPNRHVAILCSFLLGFGDASINVQIYSLLGNMYAADSAPAFALFKFIQSTTAAIGFFYSSDLILPGQLAIVSGFGIAGAVTFCLVEWLSHKEFQQSLKDSKGINLTTVNQPKAIKDQ